MALLEELVARLGFRVEGERDLARAGRTMTDTAGRVTAFAQRLAAAGVAAQAAAAAIVGGLRRVAAERARQLTALQDQAFGARAPLRSTELFARGLEAAGMSLENARSTLFALEGKLREAAESGGDLRDKLREIGVAIRANGRVRSATDVLDSVFRRWQRITDEQKRGILSALGIDDPGAQRALMANIRTFDDFRRRIREAQRQNPVFSEEEVRRAQAFQDTTAAIERVTRGIREAFQSGAIESLLGPLERLKTWLEANGPMIRERASEISNALGQIASEFAEDTYRTMVWAFDGLANAFNRLTGANVSAATMALGAVVTAFAALGRKLLFNPVFLALAAVGALLNEMRKWSQGEATPLAGFFDLIANSIRVVGEAAEAAKTQIESFFASLGIRPQIGPTETPGAIIDRMQREQRGAETERSRQRQGQDRRQEQGVRTPEYEEMLRRRRQPPATPPPATSPAAPDRRSDAGGIGTLAASILAGFENMRQIIDPARAVAAVAAAYQRPNEDRRSYENIGNDQRQVQVTVSNTVTGLEGIRSAVQNAVAAALVKGSNATTRAIDAA